MKIKNVETKNNVFLAPMAGVTTSSFRKICLKHNAGLVYAEMVSDKGLWYENAKTLEMIKVDEDEHPIAMQVFGSDSKTITSAALLIEKTSNVDIIDVNMGCPVNKVVKAGSGSALLKDPDKIYSIVKSLTDNISLPVTVKIRAGWDSSSINCAQVAKKIEAAGASAIAIHGRTRAQMYEGKANLDYIKQVKESVSIPVIGNGDIIDYESANNMFSYTNCDAIMIARGACGNPWIFDEIEACSKGLIYEKPSKEEIIKCMLEHAYMLSLKKGEHVAIVEMRTHAAWYLKNLIKTKNYKVRIVSIKTYDELVQIANEILTNDEIVVK